MAIKCDLMTESDFNKTFSNWQNKKPHNAANSQIGLRSFWTKYDSNCKEVYDMVLKWNAEYSCVTTRLTFISELNGIVYPTTECFVKYRCNKS